MIRWLHNLKIGAKAFAGSALLLICIAVLAAQAFVFLNDLKGKLGSLFDSTLPKQQQVLSIAQGAIDTHVDIFRYVAWTSTGVNQATLKSLEGRIRRESRHVAASLGELVARADISDRERDAAVEAATKWQRYSVAVDDTLEISASDPALGTLMLGGTDDQYAKVASDIQAVSALFTGETGAGARELLAEANVSQRFIAVVGLIATLLGIGATFVMSRSIVGPIETVTKALRDVSAGRAANLQLPDRGDEIGQMWSAISTFRAKLEHDNQLLAAREQELQTQNVRFDAALNNMSQGLVMFDREDRLTVANRKYILMYGLSSDIVRPGCGLRDLLEARKRTGTFAGDIDAYIAHRVVEGGIQRKIVEVPDGRTITVVNCGIQDGAWVSTHEDVTEQRLAEARIAHMARHDPLTGLPNRIQFRERLERALAEVKDGEHVALLSIDLDGFKEVNDSLGHPAGDSLLRSVADRLRACASDAGALARLGGDEFAMIHVGAHVLLELPALAERILVSLAEPVRVDGVELNIGGSLGIAVAPDHGSTADDLLKHADTALYRAKGEGRRTYRMFDHAMNAQALARRSLEAELRGALERSEFVLHYQPFVNLVTNRVTGFEALIRWNHPDRGWITPGDFIPVAEETGLINPIGEWVLRRACADAMEWPAHFTVALNLSAVQLTNRSLPQSVVLALAAAGLDPRRLELEITETALLREDDMLLAALHRLRALGARIALDDFGTGYSSLKYLRQFPLDKIKIDRSFVRELGTNSDCAAIVRAVTELGRSLNMITTAEGVETEAQLAHLRQDGCTEAQGFLFGRPRPASMLHSVIRDLEQKFAA